MVMSELMSKVVHIVVFLVLSLVMKLVSDSMGSMDPSDTNHSSVVEGLVVRPDDISERLSDIGGLRDVKEEIQYNLLLPLKNPSHFYIGGNRRLSVPRGFLLVGKPGTGKTMLARGIAKECGCTFINLTLSSMENKYYGESAKLLTAAWEYASEHSPSILFMDEVDGWLSTRSGEDGAATTGFKTELLRLMDGMMTKKGAVVVIAATNNPGMLDPALKRRLPCIIRFEVPTKEERKHILSLVTREEGGTTPKWVVDSTEGMTGSDLSHVYSTACSKRLRRCMLGGGNSLAKFASRIPPLSPSDWREALKDIAQSAKVGEEMTCTRGHGGTGEGGVRDLIGKLLTERKDDSKK